MATQQRGKQSIAFERQPILAASASVVGKKEGQGPLGKYFDTVSKDTKFGQKSWEKAENQMQKLALEQVLKKAGLEQRDLNVVFSGDLLNQCISSSFSLRNTGIPALGLYGACSTMAEALLLAGAAVSAGFAKRALAMTSSHFATSERQYRFPLGYGGQRTPTAQWTVTGAGAMLLQPDGDGPCITGGTVGAIVDKGIKDANNMGAAMAPAAYDTLRRHFDDFKACPADFDFIVTGDLGKLGKELLIELFQRDGVKLQSRYDDCGVLIYDCKGQDVHCGGSGCGCGASVLCSFLMRQLQEKKLNHILFCGTGALLSPVSTQQGESIPAVCHAVALRSERS